MRGSSRPGNVEEACSVCGERHTTTGLGVHMARAHGVVHRRTDESARNYRVASGAESVDYSESRARSNHAFIRQGSGRNSPKNR